MANLTAQRDATRRRISYLDMKHGGVVATSSTIYKGGMVGINTSGLLRRGGGVIATFNGPMVGRSKKTLVTSAAGATLEYESGIFPWVNIGSITIASRGLLCYADDDQSVSLTATNVVAGIIYDVDSEGVWVAMGLGLGSL